MDDETSTPEPEPIPWYSQDVPGVPAWQQNPIPPGPPTPPAPPIPPSWATAGGGGNPEGPADRHRRRDGGGAGVRRRFGVFALAGALIAGGGAGAATAALVAGRTTASAAPVVASVPVSPAASTTSTSSTEALVAKVEPAMVDIHTTGTSTTQSPVFGNGDNPFGGSTSTTESAGTGMILKSNGLVLTNAHVLEGASTITVELDGKTTSHPATLVGEDAAKDIALIQVQGVSGLPTVTMADSSQAQVGDAVLAIGNALDLQAGGFTASDGIISGLNRSIQTDNNESLTGLIQTSAAISSGDSGGPLVDAAGQVIGMDTAAASSTSDNTASNIGFAIPANEITGLVAQLEKGSIGQTTTGSNGSSAASGTSSSSGSGDSSGVEGGGSGSYGGYGSGGYGSYSSGLGGLSS